VEALEDRCLLSGFHLPVSPLADLSSPVAVLAPVSGSAGVRLLTHAVEVVELDTAPEDADGDVPVVNLPVHILAAVHVRFPGAELVEAERSTEGGTPVYNVTALFNGDAIELMLTTGGNLVESAQTITLDELPPALLAWVRQNLPGAVIGEAERVTAAGEVTYELLLATPGEGRVEATLRFSPAETPPATSARDPDSGQPESIRWIDSAPQGVPQEASPSGKSGPSIRPKQASAVEVAATARVEPADEWADPLVEADGSVSDEEEEFSLETVGSIGPPAWLPEIAGVIQELVTVDAAALERGLREILATIEAIAATVVGDASARSLALRLGIVAAALAAAQVVLLETTKTKREPVSACHAAQARWSWVLGDVASKRS
jgi:hypothetical protein